MSEYKVTKVSTDLPREHFNEKFNSTTYYIKVMLEGHDKAVTIGKKSANALKVGDTVNGIILPTEYDTDNFKNEFNKPGTTFAPKDQEEIKAQFAIKAAVQAFGPNTGDGYADYFADLETYAIKLFAMVEHVKNSGGNTSLRSGFAQAVSGYDMAKAQAEQLRGGVTTTTESKAPVFADGSPANNVPGWENAEPINLDDVPF